MFRRQMKVGSVSHRAEHVINRAVVETLEGRQLFHADHVHVEVNVDFQVDPTPVFPGYVADTGAVYGDRGNGWTYGFSKSVTDTARDRDSGKSLDERYDQFVTLKDKVTWNIALPNDTYEVRLVMGDPITWTGRKYIVAVEGTQAINFTPTSAQRFVEGTVTVTVTDGKLTLTGLSGSRYNNLAFIDIKTHGQEQPPPETVPADPSGLDAVGISTTQSKVTWIDNADNEDGYRVYRKLGDDGTYALIATVDANETEYLDNGLSPDTRYVYKVIAFNELGDSNFSNEDGANTFESAPGGTTVDWNQVASSPIKRAEALGGVVNGKLYVLGGLFSQNGSILATTRSDVYDPATNTWTRIKDMPEKITHAGTVIVGDTIWLIGGYLGDHPGPATNHVWKYNTSTNTWSAGPTLPKMRGAGGAGIVGNTIVFFGGMNYNRDWSAPNTWALDLNNQSAGWVAKADMPNPRNHTAAASIGGYVYAIGGQYHQEENQIAQKDVHRYDLATNTWTKVGDLPTVRSHTLSSTFVMDGKIVIVGGETAFNTVVRNVTIYDPVTDTSVEMTPLPSGRSTSVAGVLPDGRLISATGNSPNESDTTWIGTIS